MIWVLLQSELVQALLGVAGVAIAWFVNGRWHRRKARRELQKELEQEDYENAADINRRVSRDRLERLRKYDKSGFRD